VYDDVTLYDDVTNRRSIEPMCLLYTGTSASAFEKVYTLSSTRKYGRASSTAIGLLIFCTRFVTFPPVSENVYLVERTPVRERFVESLHACLRFKPLPYWVPAHPLHVFVFFF
jgi:hypothetical protein